MKELKTWRDIIKALIHGEQVQWKDKEGNWKDYTYIPSFTTGSLDSVPNVLNRIKPRTIKIGDIEVPEPVRDVSELEGGDIYYLPNLNRSKLYDIYTWGGDDTDLRLLKRGLVHKTEEAALLHAKALIKISGGSCD